MEQNRKKRKKTARTVIAIALILAAAVGVYLIVGAFGEQADEAVSVVRYQTVAVSEGEINATVSGSGTLTATEQVTATAPADARVETVNYRAGDRVQKGDVVLTLSSETVDAELAALYTELQTAQNRLAGTTKARTNRNITAPRAGIVKELQVEVGSAAEDVSYLCKIATDDLMRVTVETDALRRYARVTVRIGEETVEGTVSETKNGEAIVTFEDNGYSVGTAAEVVTESGERLIGTVDVNDHVVVLCEGGCIEEVRAAENQRVNKGAVLFVLEKGAPSSTYQSRLASVQEIEQEIETLEKSLIVQAAFDALVAAMHVQAGDEVVSGTALCLLTSTDGYTLSLGIDELDISDVQVGQTASVTLEAIEGTFSGRVTDLSFDGSGSYVTTYTATVTTEPIEGVYPGMSASAAIVTKTSDKSLIVPVAAVQYEGESTFLYLAGAGGVESLEGLDRIEVETGMSDGSYIAVSGDGLQKGDRIVVPTRTTTAVYEKEQSSTMPFAMPNMGGQMPNMGGNMGERPNMGSQRGNRGN